MVVISGGIFVSLSDAASCHNHAKSADLGKILNQPRPAEVDDRLVIDHWEGDTVFKGHNVRFDYTGGAPQWLFNGSESAKDNDRGERQ